MSLYKMVRDGKDTADLAVALLHLPGQITEELDFGRFRNAWVETDEDDFIVSISTKNGGGNREDYQHVFDGLARHPWWVVDEDDEFDETFAYIDFRVPAEVVEEFDAALAAVRKVDSPDWLEEVIAAMQP